MERADKGQQRTAVRENGRAEWREIQREAESDREHWSDVCVSVKCVYVRKGRPDEISTVTPRLASRLTWPINN